MLVEDVTIGADPEVFLVDASNIPISAIGLIGGSKEHPRAMGDGFFLQEDNVAVEFNIPPAQSVEEFKKSIEHSLNLIRKELQGTEHKINISPTLSFSKKELDHPKAKELGCDPDFNVWTSLPNPSPKAPEDLRSGGGHIHIGYKDPSEYTNAELVKAMDLFCGVGSLSFDKDTTRRDIYGKAGAHRVKGYGVEYRTLSNAWLTSPDKVDWVYKQTQRAIDFVNADGFIDSDNQELILKAINDNCTESFDILNDRFSIV